MGKWPKLDRIEMIDGPIDKKDYQNQIDELQHRLLDLQTWHLRTGGRVLIGLDGWDAAGKGGLIERLVAGLEPKSTHVWRISAPTPDEQGRHYLWRFWQKLPAPSELAIFDRTWYGRVLVERVEKFASKPEWRRSYEEINQFEKMLVDDGCPVIKIFLHITKDEQLSRFKEREKNPYKHWKITKDDWRNRNRWKDYEHAIDDMFERTDTGHSPWLLVAANHKWFARTEALKAVVTSLERWW